MNKGGIYKKNEELAACALEPLRSNKGMVLLMALAMIFLLACVLMVCAFALKPEANQDERHAITLQRMLEVKRALIGRLADTGGGMDISSCGGFISDYGEPNNTSTFDVNDLLGNTSGFTAWGYDPTHFFWAGYRGERYLEANAEDSSGPIFIDGWGNKIEVSFDDEGIIIKSLGKDGIEDTEGSEPGDYRRDITESFFWQRDVKTPSGSGFSFRILYPKEGTLESSGWKSGGGILENIPVGLRKLEINNGGNITQRVVCIHPGEEDYRLPDDIGDE